MKRRWLRASTTILTIVFLFVSSPGTALALSYRVQWGDSLWKLANRYGTTVQEIQRANNLWSTWIYAGETLIIPDSNWNQPAPTPAPSPAPAPGGGSFPASAWEEDLLARLISAEAGGESYTGQVAVGAVVLNRVRSNIFPNTIYGVTYERWQFEPVMNGWINNPASDSAKKAARDALNGWDPTGGALYFFNWRTVSNSFLWSLPYKVTIGNHRFAG